MTTLTCLRGYPGSGKSTLARSLPGVVVGRDYLRKQLYGQYRVDNDAEAVVTVAEQAQVTALLNAGHDVTVDDMNVNPRYLRDWAKLARDLNVEFAVHDVPTSVDTCIRRDVNKQRLDDGKTVGEAVIRKIAKRWPISGWPSIRVNPKPTVEMEPYIPLECTTPAIIVDIDGTMAAMVDRSPFDYSKVGEDAVHQVIVDLVNREYKSGAYVIVCSGRDASCRTATERWLSEVANVSYDLLLMRPDEAKDGRGNKLPDTVIKYQLFDEHIRNYFDVRYVLDDRQSVVDMWRTLGLKCLQVQPGDF